MNEETLKLLNTPPVEWEATLVAMTPETRGEVSLDLSALMERAARLKGYIEGRYLYNERPHDFGVMASNKLAEKIRRAIGFAYPKQDITF